MLELKDLRISNDSLGTQMLLVDIKPVYEYVDGTRTEKVIGHKYVCGLPAHALATIDVKIDGKQRIDTPADGYTTVSFDNLIVSAYQDYKTKTVYIRAKADGIHAV